jgi:phage tail-like protein
MPPPMTGLVAWFKGDADLTNDGVTVSAWADQSGNGNDLSVPGGLDEPEYSAGGIDGIPAVKYTAADQTLDRAGTNLVPGGSDRSLFIVCRPADSAGGSLFTFRTGTKDWVAYLFSLSGNQYVWSDGIAELHVVTPVDYTGQELLVEHEQSAQTLAVAINAADIPISGTATTTIEDGATGFTVGNRAVASYFQKFSGEIAEVLVYDHALTVLEKHNVRLYLAGRYPSLGLSFASADRLLAATPLGGPIGEARRRVHVTFAQGAVPAEPVDDTAFDVDAWSLVPDVDSDQPRYTPTIIEAVADDDRLGVTLVADQELTPGIVYSATCRDVTGIANDGIDNVAAFEALRIVSAPASRSFRLLDWLPPINASEDSNEDEARFVGSLQEVGDLLFDYVDRWVEIFDADLAPERFLDLLLADLGNPFIFPEALSITEKRKLCQLLVQIYKLKGTIPGIQAAILFFLGLQSEFIAYDGLGSLLGDALSVGDAELGQSAGNSPTQFFLGAGGPYQFIAKLGTTSPEAGALATALEVDRALRIIRIMKPVGFELLDILAGLIQSGARHSRRNAIRDNGGGSIDLIMERISDSDEHVFFVSNQPGVQQFNTQAELAASVSGSTAVVAAYDASAGDLYFNGVGKNNGDDTRGLLFNEVTNALTKPVVTATSGPRKITLTWATVAGATSYRIYRSTATFTSPTVADNADAPIEVSGDLAEYVDRLESGTTRFYRVTPVIAHNTSAFARLAFDAEGFFSDEDSATAA